MACIAVLLLVVTTRFGFASIHPVIVESPYIHRVGVIGRNVNELPSLSTTVANMGTEDAVLTFVWTDCSCHAVLIDEVLWELGEKKTIPGGGRITISLPLSEATIGTSSLAQAKLRLEYPDLPVELIQISRQVTAVPELMFSPPFVRVSSDGDGGIEFQVTANLGSGETPLAIGVAELPGISLDDPTPWAQDSADGTHAWKCRINGRVSEATGVHFRSRPLDLQVPIAVDGKESRTVYGQLLCVHENSSGLTYPNELYVSSDPTVRFSAQIKSNDGRPFQIVDCVTSNDGFVAESRFDDARTDQWIDVHAVNRDAKPTDMSVIKLETTHPEASKIEIALHQ